MSHVAAAIASDGGHYLHVGVINIGVTNLAIIAGMVVVFILALVLPFPGPRDRRHDDPRAER
jgi:hypothetical protein